MESPILNHHLSAEFIRYFLVGIVNTAIHWGVYAFTFLYVAPSQAVANTLGFACAVTFSFFANAAFTFSSRATVYKYVIFATFMGLLSFLQGYLFDHLGLAPAITPVVFSFFSLFIGFIYSKFLVFRY